MYCYVHDEFKHSSMTLWGIHIDHKKAQYLMLILMCIGGPTLASQAGIYYLEFYDYFMSNIPFTLWVTIELYVFVYLFPLSELETKIKKYTKVKTPWIIEYCLKSYWLPGLLIANLFFATWNQVILDPMQLFVWEKYTFWFGVFGWLFSLYPVIAIYWVLRKEWPGWDQLKLTFA
jgi:hypothetical protein